MLKRTLAIAALGAALLGGPPGISHVRSAMAQESTPTADLILTNVSAQAADGDATAPCTNKGTPTEAGDCTDSQNHTGQEDTTLDTRGHGASTFRAGQRIELPIQWVVRHAPKGAQQTAEWVVLYAGHQIFHVTRHSGARNGNWVRIATATISRQPNLGSHVFRAQIDVAGVRSERSVAFTVRR